MSGIFRTKLQGFHDLKSSTTNVKALELTKAKEIQPPLAADFTAESQESSDLDFRDQHLSDDADIEVFIGGPDPIHINCPSEVIYTEFNTLSLHPESTFKWESNIIPTWLQWHRKHEVNCLNLFASSLDGWLFWLNLAYME